MKFHLFLLTLFSYQALAYYHFHDDFKEDNERSILKDSKVDFVTTQGEKFPSSFTFGYKSEEQDLKFEFVLGEKLETHAHAHDGRSFRSVEKKTEYRHYRDLNQNAVATLIENDLSDEKFRFMISYHNPLTNQQIDIYPVLEGTALRHAIHKRSESTEEEKKFFAYTETKLREKRSESELLSRKTSQSQTSRSKRQAQLRNQAQFYVESVIVTESRVYRKYQNLLNSNDEILVQEYMKIFYSHLINAVNQRFYLSLNNFGPVMISVVLKGMVIETSQSQSNWSNPTVVGDINEKYAGKDVIFAQPAFLELSSYMVNLNLPYKYDHVFGVSVTSLTAPETSSMLPLSMRSGYSGYTIVGGMCSSRTSLSLIEESGFTSASVFDHELGHNLGLQHDGVNNPCKPLDNFLMTAITGLPNNTENLFYFSNCSIRNFARQIIVAGGVKAAFRCLLNVPVSSSLLPETQYDNDLLPGQLWNVDQQCQIAFSMPNSQATICGVYPNEVCQTLFCLDPSKDMCFATSGWGAIDGTKCDTGKICNAGQCVNGNLTVLSSNQCSPNPCQNGGVCSNVYQLHICTCPSGFTGAHCENAI